MKVTLNWLKQYVDFNWSAAELAERLTMLGLEVEGIEKLGGEFEGIVVAQVLTVDKHPNADKLTVCRVADGQGERQIVCGARNFQAGDKVPLILPGASLPAKAGEEPFVIKVGKIRGVESHGMMCSPKELGLAEEAEGLLILPPEAPVGQPFAAYLGRTSSDVVFDLEVTPNRPDLNSVLGIAREIAAVTGNPLRIPEARIPDMLKESRIAESRIPDGTSKEDRGVESRIAGNRGAEERTSEGRNAEARSGEGAAPGDVPPVASLVAVRIEDAELCPRYTARVVLGVKIGPSPDWLRRALEKVGLRSINNVVDVTNYVMLESGQPLHAFDYHLVARSAQGLPTIVVRRAQPGERFVTLDGQAHTLTGEMLLIADEAKGIALAGVMGGQNSEINERTVDVLVESAYFKPTSIRRTSKTLGLRTDASYRFERGADLGTTDWASQRCAQLILETAGGRLAPGVVDAYPAPVEPHQITLRHAKVSELLGIPLKPEETEYYLGQLGLKIVGRKPRPLGAEPGPEPVTFRIPTFRVDLKRETDLIEEVCRLHGVDRIPATAPRGAIGSNDYDAVHDQLAEARRMLAGLGLHEAQGQTLVSMGRAQRERGAWMGESDKLIAAENPLSRDMDALRPSLLYGLIDVLRNNANRANAGGAFFEIGRVFTQEHGKVIEARRLALAMTGKRYGSFWDGFASRLPVDVARSLKDQLEIATFDERSVAVDIYDLKGALEEFLDRFGIGGVNWLSGTEANSSGPAAASPFYLDTAEIRIGRLKVGLLGRLHPMVARHYEVDAAVFLAELDFDQLLARRNAARSFKPLPQFPSVRRDVAMVVPEIVRHEAVLAAVRQAKAANLETVELFDVFRGQHIPAGQKSLAYALTYRSGERTLTDAEVNAAHEKVVAHLKQTLGAVVREA